MRDGRAGETVSFGAFRLSAAARLLVKDTEPVALGSRSLDILIALVERPGEVVSTGDLFRRVWPDVVVEEGSLRVHLARLRKALGEGQDGARYITTIPGRGYCFVAPVQDAGQDEPSTDTPSRPAKPQRLPRPLLRMVGRDKTIAALCALLRARRFVSIVGPGGMGKTTVAVAVAHELLWEFGEAVCFVDLGALADPSLVAGAVGAALGCFIQAPDPVSGLLAYLAGKQMLLILDNCEHLIGAVAALAERLFAEAPLVHLLATSREALRVEGETVHLLAPLESPLDNGALTAAQALASPAIQLFMERAVASGYESELTDADAPTVAGICRRLDGIALAIELAGSRVGAHGIQATADLLDHRFKLLWRGQRSALPRHQTLQAMLDWSYNLLSEREKTVLCKLSVFVGHFTLDGALSVAGDDAPDVFDAVASVVDKSLVWASELGGSTYYRLPDTTRAYAAAKLAETQDEDAVRSRHARHYATLFDPCIIRAKVFVERNMSAYVPHLGNVRAALDWCFSEAGDAAVGAELAARAAPLFLGFRSLGECEHWCERGIAALHDEDRGTKRELYLREALAISSMFTRGNGEEVRAAIERGLVLAETLGNRNYQLRLLAGLHLFLVRIADFQTALVAAERSLIVAHELGDPAGIVMAEWMLGVSHHLVGDQAAAQRHCELGLELAAARGLTHFGLFGFDHRVRALVALARALWLRGRPERALKFAQQAIDEAASGDCPVTLCISFIYTIPILLCTGDFERASERIERLIAHAAKHSLRPYHTVGHAMKGVLMVARGEPRAGVELLQGALAMLQAEQHHIYATVSSRALAEGLAHSGQFEEAVATITRAIERAEQGGGTFDLPDLWRARAEIMLAAPQPDLAAAEQALVRARDLARKQSALAWELRATIQLARLWAQRRRAQDARDQLAGVYERFTEGLETPDRKAARRLLDELEAAPARSPALSLST
jgi:predicted ATPase/DNA-binding winged helix-turn-helix (wHTH) protein